MADEERCPQCGGYRGLPRMLDMTSDAPHECANEFHKSEAPVEAEVIEFPSQPNTAPEQAQTSVSANPVQKPLCPYCGAEGKTKGQMTSYMNGKIEVVVVSCAECRKILFGFQALQLHMMPPPGLTH
jgi:ssDNA-binding Zn-finger/Zn-ribbon topoisomerase 1